VEAGFLHPASPAFLAVAELNAWYGESHVLHRASFNVLRGELVMLLGRNGAGKSTILRSIIGMMKKRAGSIRFDGVETISLPACVIARKGVGFVPENRGVFGSLTVAENLALPPITGPGGLSDSELLDLFPNLKERLNASGKWLSGGEQQMLSIARILRTGVRILLLDEPSEGLAPAIVKRIARIIALLKERGLTIVLVEQNLSFAKGLVDRHYIVEEGRVVDEFSRDEIDAEREKVKRYLSV
jgi:branched-chain amino acid transport system ATP-binding protein